MGVEPGCRACGGMLRPWRAVPSAEPALGPEVVALARCRACGSAWTLGGAPAELHDSGAYGPQRPRGHSLARPLLDAFDRQRLRLLRRSAPPPARVLDVGAGRGRWVLAARRAGYEATGIEPSRRGVAAAQAIGAPVARESVQSAKVAPGSLDAVTLWHVLEHLEDPAAALEALRGWLRPGGTLLMGVPNLSSLQARLAGGRWYHLDVPRHRAHLTPAGARALLDRCGFQVVEVHHVLLEHNPYGMWQSLVNRLTRRPSYLYNLLKHNAPARSRDLVITLLALPLLPAAGLLELGAAVCRRGGTIAVVARRSV